MRELDPKRMDEVHELMSYEREEHRQQSKKFQKIKDEMRKLNYSYEEAIKLAGTILVDIAMDASDPVAFMQEVNAHHLSVTNQMLEFMKEQK